MIECTCQDDVFGRTAGETCLIGSFARGQEDCDSDIDLLVVKDTDLPRHKRARELRKMIAPYKYPLDLLVYSRDEFEKGKMSPALLPTRPSERESSSMDEETRKYVSSASIVSSAQRSI